MPNMSTKSSPRNGSIAENVDDVDLYLEKGELEAKEGQGPKEYVGYGFKKVCLHD